MLQGREYGPALPFTIFAIINIIAGLICLLLPETNNTPLPSSIQEAKDLSKYVSLGYFISVR